MPAFRHIPLSPLGKLAALSVVLLLAVIGYRTYVHTMDRLAATTYTAPDPAPAEHSEPSTSWQQEMILLGLATSTDTGVSDGTDPVNMITPSVLAQIVGEYNGLRASGRFSTSTAADAASSIAPDVYANIPYTMFAPSQIKTDANSSYERMLAYRTDMQAALKPLLDNKEAEYAIYGRYVETGDTSYLRELRQAAKNYDAAAAQASRVTTPADILSTHLSIVNSLSRFSATLDALALHGADPIASLALLRTYNDAEASVVNSFDTLAHYERMKQP